MTLLEEDFRETYREGSTPVLETERLVLRAPRLEDAKAVVTLASDRRVAENTARIPHPYRLADAGEWISSVGTDGGKHTFLITLDEHAGRRLRHRPARRSNTGTRLLARRAVLGPRLCDRSGARRHRSRLRGPRSRGVTGGCAGEQSCFPARTGKMRVPMDRRWPLPHPRHEFVRPVRPFPARPRYLGVAQKLGQHTPRRINGGHQG